MLRHLKLLLHFYQPSRMNVLISLRHVHMQLALASNPRHSSLVLEEYLASCNADGTTIIEFLLIVLDY